MPTASVLADSLETVFTDQEPRPMNENMPITAFARETAALSAEIVRRAAVAA